MLDAPAERARRNLVGWHGNGTCPDIRDGLSLLSLSSELRRLLPPKRLRLVGDHLSVFRYI